MIFGKLKILLLGSAQSGKTSILDVYNQKMTNESPTVGISVTSGTVLDNSGQRRKPTPVRFYDMDRRDSGQSRTRQKLRRRPSPGC